TTLFRSIPVVIQRVILRAFQKRVDKVGDKHKKQGAIKPAPPSQKVPAKALVLVDAIRKQQAGNHGKNAGIHPQETVSSKAPALLLEQRKLKPPEVRNKQQNKGHPDDVREIRLFLPRVLNKARQAGDQP